MTEQTPINPLLCDPETGACELPGTGTENAAKNTETSDKPVRIIYFTDPICSSCWGIEPQLRKLKLEYGDAVSVEYRMGGLLPSWDIYNSGGISKPSDVAHHWDEVSAYYEMPIDGDVWLEDPLSSSYPPSIAFKAAQMQSPERAVAFLRRIREMVFLEKKNITRREHLLQAASQTGLDPVRFRADLDGKAESLFRQDLELAQKWGVRGFPTLFFTDAEGKSVKVYGVKPYEVFETALRQVYPQATKKPYDFSWEGLFAHYPTLTSKEFAVLSGRSKTDAETYLDALTKEGKLKKSLSKNGPIWKR